MFSDSKGGAVDTAVVVVLAVPFSVDAAVAVDVALHDIVGAVRQ